MVIKVPAVSLSQKSVVIHVSRCRKVKPGEGGFRGGRSSKGLDTIQNRRLIGVSRAVSRSKRARLNMGHKTYMIVGVVNTDVSQHPNPPPAP